MAKYYVTFGQKYRDEPHPQGGHPDGYFVIEAGGEDEARAKAWRQFDNKWCMIYEEAEFDKSMYPKGDLAPKALTEEELQDLNLDCMTTAELEGLLPRLELGEGLVEIQLWTYAYLKIGAMKWRERGVIQMAELLERNCESIYKELPSRYLW
jgi:hypothetical protein